MLFPKKINFYGKILLFYIVIDFMYDSVNYFLRIFVYIAPKSNFLVMKCIQISDLSHKAP